MDDKDEDASFVRLNQQCSDSSMDDKDLSFRFQISSSGFRILYGR